MDRCYGNCIILTASFADLRGESDVLNQTHDSDTLSRAFAPSMVLLNAFIRAEQFEIAMNFAIRSRAESQEPSHFGVPQNSVESP